MSQSAGGDLITHSNQLCRRGALFSWEGYKLPLCLSALLDGRAGRAKASTFILHLTGQPGLLSAGGEKDEASRSTVEAAERRGAAGVIAGEMTT